VPAVHGSAIERGGSEAERDHHRREADQVLGQRRRRREERLLYVESDVERAVRDRLYGRRGLRD
jgi:hypothetical protein